MTLLLQNRSQRLNQRIILAVVIFMAPIVGMGIDLYTPSLPAISTYFDVRGLYVKLTLFTYLIGYGVGQLFFGPLSDAYGRRKPILWGVAVYIIISLLLALAPNIESLLIMRLLRCLFLVGTAIFMAIGSVLHTQNQLPMVFTFIALIITGFISVAVLTKKKEQ